MVVPGASEGQVGRGSWRWFGCGSLVLQFGSEKIFFARPATPLDLIFPLNFPLCLI